MALADESEITWVSFTSTNLTTINNVQYTTIAGSGNVSSTLGLNSPVTAFVGGGVFTKIYASAQNLAGTTNFIEIRVNNVAFDFAKVNGLSFNGTTANHIFRLNWNTSTREFTFSTMGAGINGPVSSMVVHNGKLYVVGDFDYVGGGYNFEDFAIYTISSSSWWTYPAKLQGYDGFQPAEVTFDGTLIEIRLDSNSWGALADYYGSYSIPYTTEIVRWHPSNEEWWSWD